MPWLHGITFSIIFKATFKDFTIKNNNICNKFESIF